MKIVVAFGGLGNVMFYYALVTAFRKKGVKSFVFLSKTNLEHNNYKLNKIFPHISQWGNLNFFQKYYYYLIQLIRNLHYKKYKIPHKYLFFPFNGLYSDKEPVNYIPSVFDNLWKDEYLVGYFQSYKYFEEYRDIILEEFNFSIPSISQETKELLDMINGCISVSIHVRRGDYLNGYYYDLLGKVCNRDYYNRAVEIIKTKVDNPRFFIFSDDSDYVKTNLEIENAMYVNFNRDDDFWQDMYLMSVCKHNIIANSTFSWWGAWLNRNPNKIVVAPNRWFADKVDDDIIPSGWLRI